MGSTYSYAFASQEVDGAKYLRIIPRKIGSGPVPSNVEFTITPGRGIQMGTSKSSLSTEAFDTSGGSIFYVRNSPTRYGFKETGTTLFSFTMKTDYNSKSYSGAGTFSHSQKYRGSSSPGTTYELTASCFPVDARVETRDPDGGEVESVEMGLVTAGTLVRTGPTTYEPLLGFTHADATWQGPMVRIVCQGGARCITASPGHYLVITTGSREECRTADSVRPGDTLVDGYTGEPRRVATTSIVRATGRMSPLTPSGRIVVDGLVASCYTAHYEAGLVEHALIRHVLPRLPTRVAGWILAAGTYWNDTRVGR